MRRLSISSGWQQPSDPYQRRHFSLITVCSNLCYYSCLAAKMSTLAGFCSLTEYLYICRRLYNEATEKCTYPAWQPAPRQSTASPKILPVLPRWQVNQLYLQVFLSIALPKICAAVGIIMGRPRAFMELNNRCAAHWENPLLLCQHVCQL